jgi:hypothetical protein
LEKHHGPELVRLRELEEAAELTNSAVDIGLYQLRQEADFPENSPSAFDAWMREGTGEIERGSASGSSGGEKPISATTSETVDAGPSVQEIVDEVFARALPQLYPDHPVNRGLPNRAA